MEQEKKKKNKKQKNKKKKKKGTYTLDAHRQINVIETWDGRGRLTHEYSLLKKIPEHRAHKDAHGFMAGIDPGNNHTLSKATFF